jgi:hypothetical protein
MVLAASDELRHPHNELFTWRESLYFNFADAKLGLGGWIYLWVVPNKPVKSGMLVSVYKGVTDRLSANDLAVQSPGHRYVGDHGNWVYCYKQDFMPLLTADFDNVELGGLRLQRGRPLQTYRIEFTDDADTRMRLDAEFAMHPYDYADGPHPTPSWVATNRYHRSWRVKGQLEMAGEVYTINATGDSDHSWGNRDMEEFSKHTFKMWSFQTPNARRSVSVIEQGAGLYLGFVDIDGDVRGVTRIEHASQFSPTGVQRQIEVTITDAAGRLVAARLPEMFSAIGHGEPEGLWGFEGVGTYTVDDWGPCTGVASYFWSPTTTPAQLHAGDGTLA